MNESEIIAFDLSQLFSKETFDEIYDIEDETEATRLKSLLLARSKQLNSGAEMKKAIKAYDAANKQLSEDYTAQNARANAELPLQFDSSGRPATTIENFMLIFEKDSSFKGLRFNLLTNSVEKTENNISIRWQDTDDAFARNYIEKKYKLYHPNKMDDALKLVADRRSYHPVRDIIGSLVWDGKDHISGLLTRWLKCADTPYVQEISRLIFAGGIHRIYRPGCKFDDVPVLIGTKQGEGKSSFVRWLALKDSFYTEVTDIESQKGIEAIEGAWICEIVELLALTKAKEVEAVKSYITKQSDKYRKPFDRRVTEQPRQCIFIGTTNKEQFLTDKTGNRRFYPVKVYSNGYELFANEKEVKSDILQCWAQAKVMFDKGTLAPMATVSIIEAIQKEQNAAIEDDYREGLIKGFLEDKNKTCVLDIWEHAFGYQFTKPSKKDSNEIVLILQNLEEWEKGNDGKVVRFSGYGVQKIWVRKTNIDPQNSNLPFKN